MECSEFLNLYAQLDGQRRDWNGFIEGNVRLIGMREYGINMDETFAYFHSVAVDRNSEWMGKVSYFAKLYCRFSYYGAPNDPVEAICFMKIVAEHGVFHSFVDLTA